MGKDSGTSGPPQGSGSYDPTYAPGGPQGPAAPYGGGSSGMIANPQPGVPQAGSPNVFSQAAGNMQNAGNALGAAGAGYGSTSPIWAGMSSYMNPFENQVVGNTMQDIDRQRMMAQTQNAGNAAQAGAFGGARHGLVEAQTNEAAMREMGRTSADLRHQGFMTSGNFANEDIQNRLRAAGGIAALAPQYGGLAQTGFNMGQQTMGQQRQDADMIRGISESLIGQSAGMFDRYTGQPSELLRMRLGALGANPLQQASTVTAQQQSSDLSGTLGGLGSLLFGAAKVAPFLSDRRAKLNVQPLEKTDSGLQMYAFQYRDGSPNWYKGVMAQDLLKDDRHKAAVYELPTGMYAVDYAQLGIEMKSIPAPKG